jgi:predicted  nucleic acid-binding Zn-ribbon protein
MEQNIKQNLEALAKMQHIDTELYHIIQLRGDLPIEVDSLKTECSSLIQKLSLKENSLQEANNLIIQQKSSVKEKQLSLQRYEKQKDEISNSREYDAVAKAIELYSLDIQIAEKKIKNAYIAIEVLKPEIENIKVRLNQTNEVIQKKESELQSIISKQNLIESDLKKDREKLIPLINLEVLDNYDKVRKKMVNGIGAAKVSRGACGGCFMVVTAQKQIDIASKNSIQRCDYCGVTLLDASLEEIPETGAYAKYVEEDLEIAV